jgi:hypothetical protein
VGATPVFVDIDLESLNLETKEPNNVTYPFYISLLSA